MQWFRVPDGGLVKVVRTEGLLRFLAPDGDSIHQSYPPGEGADHYYIPQTDSCWADYAEIDRFIQMAMEAAVSVPGQPNDYPHHYGFLRYMGEVKPGGICGCFGLAVSQFPLKLPSYLEPIGEWYRQKS